MFGVSVGIMDGAGGAAGGSYESIAKANGTGSSNTITFSSIPSTYKHLQIRALSQNTGTGTGNVGMYIRLNSDSSTNYTTHYLRGNGTTAVAAGSTSTAQVFADKSVSRTGNTNMFGVIIIDIHDYQSTTKNKTVRTFGGVDLNTTSGELQLTSGVWLNTAAVNTVSLVSEQDNWTTTSVFSLYGIKG